MFLLSDIERDANDNVVRVGATMMTWLLDNTESVIYASFYPVSGSLGRILLLLVCVSL